MTNLARYHAANLPDLLDKISKNSIGMDEYLNRFFNETTQQNYPPYNIIHVNNVESRLEIALAGFKKKEVKVYTEYGKLVVERNKRQIYYSKEKAPCQRVLIHLELMLFRASLF